jgi:hypothetical protein
MQKREDTFAGFMSQKLVNNKNGCQNNTCNNGNYGSSERHFFAYNSKENGRKNREAPYVKFPVIFVKKAWASSFLKP